MIQATIQSKLPAVDEDCAAALHAGDCFVIGDGGKHGNQAAFHHAFVDKSGAHLSKVAKSLFVCYKRRTVVITRLEAICIGNPPSARLEAIYITRF